MLVLLFHGGYKEVDDTKDDKCFHHLPELNKELALVHFVIVIHCVVKICYWYPLCGIHCILYVHYIVVKYVTGNDVSITLS